MFSLRLAVWALILFALWVWAPTMFWILVSIFALVFVMLVVRVRKIVHVARIDAGWGDTDG